MRRGRAASPDFTKVKMYKTVSASWPLLGAKAGKKADDMHFLHQYMHDMNVVGRTIRLAACSPCSAAIKQHNSAH
jgi:hypothetical protein